MALLPVHKNWLPVREIRLLQKKNIEISSCNNSYISLKFDDDDKAHDNSNVYELPDIIFDLRNKLACAQDRVNVLEEDNDKLSSKIGYLQNKIENLKAVIDTQNNTIASFTHQNIKMVNTCSSQTDTQTYDSVQPEEIFPSEASQENVLVCPDERKSENEAAVLLNIGQLKSNNHEGLDTGTNSKACKKNVLLLTDSHGRYCSSFV